MSINLGLDGLRKAVIRASLIIDELPGKTRDLGDAMVQQRIALKAATQTSEFSQRKRKEGLKLSQERMQQIARSEASERRQTLKNRLGRTAQRYQAGQGVAEKVSNVSSQAMSVVTSGAKLLKPGYKQATATAPDEPGYARQGHSLAPAADNLAGDIGQLNVAIDAISLTVFTQLDGMLRSLTQTATGLISSIDRWIQDNPALAGGITQLVACGGLLIAALGGIGSVVVPVLSGLNLLMAGAGVLSSVFTFAGGAIAAALGAITLPVGIAVAAVVAAAALIYQYWEPLSAFFSGVIDGVKVALAPLFEAFKPLKPIFDEVSALIALAFDKIKSFFSPIAMTAEKLEQLGNLGNFVGQALVKGLSLPMTILRSLGGMISGLLEKLGLIDKKSADAAESLPGEWSEQRSLPVPGGAGYRSLDTPYTAAPGGSYKPVTSGSTNSQQNTFNSSYVINTHSGMSDADVLAMIERNRQQERLAAELKQRSSVWS